MGFNGAGTYSRLTPAYSGSTSWQQEEAGGFGKVATRHDVHDQDIAASVSNLITKDGQTTVTANIPLGGNHLVNVGTGTSRSSLTTIGGYQDGGPLWAGVLPYTGNSYTGTPTPAVTAYVEGMEVYCIPSHTNTATAAFFSLSSLPVYRISHKREGIADPELNVGEIRFGEILHLIFSSVAGGQWVIANQEFQQWQSWTPAVVAPVGLGTPSVLGAKYLVKDDICYWHMSLFIGTVMTGYTAAIFSLPVPATNTDQYAMGFSSGEGLAIKACLIRVSSGGIAFSASAKDFFVDTFASNGYFLGGSGVYEIA